MIFVAGGSGLSSPKSMVVELLAEGCKEDITLVQGARSLDELYFREFFEDLAGQHENFHYLPVLSDAVRGRAVERRPRLRARGHEGPFKNDFRGHKAYLCGPPPMIEACIATLMQGRLFEGDIYTEKFITAADAEGAARRSPLFKNI